MISIEINGRRYGFDESDATDISVPLHFNGPQPNAYGVERATSKPCEAGELVGDTRRGGSVNFEQYTLIPHCNGTHTECVGHMTHERISLRDCLTDVFSPAALISVEPESSAGEHQITVDLLRSAFASGTPAVHSALIVRTLPNDDSKLMRQYGEGNIPPYFTSEAMEWIVKSGFKHLLVDMPSIDRIYDDGKLVNHRIFWNVEPGRFETNVGTRVNNTITELIYVPNSVSDGEYLMNLQIAPFEADAAPSRPILFKSEPPA